MTFMEDWRTWRLKSATRKIIVPFALISFFSIVFSGLSVAVDEQQSFGFQPVIQTVRVEVGEELNDGYWLAGLSSEARGEPDVLALSWSKASTGWLSSWNIHFVSAANVLPPSLVSRGDGFLQGYDVFRLAGVAPEPGQVYLVTLSFDPGTGAAGISVKKENDPENPVVSRGVQVRPIDVPFYDAMGSPRIVNSDALVHTAIEGGFLPIGLDWSLVMADGPDATKALRPEAVDRRQSVWARLRLPWDELPGEIRVHVNGGEVVSLSGVGDGATLIPLPVNDLAAGGYRVSMQYFDGGAVHELGSDSIKVGLIEVHLDAVESQLISPGEVMVTGELVVTADGPVPRSKVHLDAVIERIVLAPSIKPSHRHLGKQHEHTQQVLVEDIALTGLGEVRIPFETTVNIRSKPEGVYDIWNIALTPSVISPVTAEIVTYEETVRLEGCVCVQTDEKVPESIRVMTYNIQAGRGMDDRIDLQRLADVMASSGADIIGLQEVDRETRRSGHVDQARVIAEILGMEYVFGENIQYQGGGYGNAIISRYPIISADNQHLTRSGNEEQRGLLRAVIDVDGQPLDFYVTHLTHTSPEDNDVQQKEIIDRIQDGNNPFIVLGDFNYRTDLKEKPRGTLYPYARDAWFESVILKAREQLKEPSDYVGYTYNSLNPSRRIDYIFLSETVDVVDDHGIFIIETIASDHIPIVAEVHIDDVTNDNGRL